MYVCTLHIRPGAMKSSIFYNICLKSLSARKETAKQPNTPPLNEPKPNIEFLYSRIFYWNQQPVEENNTQKQQQKTPQNETVQFLLMNL